MDNLNKPLLSPLAIPLLILMLMTYLLSLVFFIIGYPISYLPISLSFIFALIDVQHTIKNFNFKAKVKINMLFIAICIGIPFITMRLFDFSWDGNWYHGFGIYQMAQNAYNPYYSSLTSTAPHAGFWFINYPKAQEILSAALAFAANNLEAGKASTSFFAVIAYLLSKRLLDQLLSTSKNSWLSFIIVFNPVVIVQLLTNYVDAQLYLLDIIIIELILYILIVQISSTVYFLLFTAIVYAVNIKLSNLLWLSILLLVLLINVQTCRIKVRYPIVIVVVTAFIFGVIVAGYNPYLHNLIAHQSIIYPLNKIDIIASNSPKYFIEHNRVWNFLLSITGFTGNEINQFTTVPSFFNFPGWGLWLRNISTPDARVAGWGPLFIISIVLFLYLSYRAYQLKQTNRLYLVNVSAILIITFITPYGWWARYNPFLWLLPVIGIIFLQKNDNLNQLRKILFISLLINQFILIACVIAGQTYRQHRFSQLFSSQGLYLVNFNQDDYIFAKQKLKTLKVNFITDNSLDCQLAESIPSTGACFKNIR